LQQQGSERLSKAGTVRLLCLDSERRTKLTRKTTKPAKKPAAKKSAAKKAAPVKKPAPKKKASAPETILLSRILKSLDDDKAEEVVSIDMDGHSSLCDTIVIANGRSSRHVASIASIWRGG